MESGVCETRTPKRGKTVSAVTAVLSDAANVTQLRHKLTCSPEGLLNLQQIGNVRIAWSDSPGLFETSRSTRCRHSPKQTLQTLSPQEISR